MAKLRRVIALGGALALGAWFARLLAHSKKPPPEGHWRELDTGKGDQDR